MARRDKHSAKQKRKAEHIEEAWAMESGRDKKSGSGLSYAESHGLCHMGGRRRPRDDMGIHQSTLGSDYTPNEVEFMLTMDRYKRENRRPFPTWSEVLQVLLQLGYRKVAAPSMGNPTPLERLDELTETSSSPAWLLAAQGAWQNNALAAGALAFRPDDRRAGRKC